jgi:hypothetical protein
MALGKAIVSIDLDRALPAPLEHGVHIHYVTCDRAAMEDAIELINSNDNYRRHLEIGSRAWFDAHMAPAVVARRLIDRAA